jgi:glycosyltransferase involved in cell wall biosynthesis
VAVGPEIASPLDEPAGPPHVSIVVGSYNRLTALCELLERFLTQDWQDFEVIVIEQSALATDAERERLNQLAGDERIRIFRREPLGGAGARNEGCRLARGEIIVAFDDDDLPASNRWLSAMLKNFEDPRCLAVSGRHIVEGGADPPYVNMARARRQVLSYSVLMWQRCYVRTDVRSERIQNLMGGNSAFRRSVFERCGLWDTFTRCENENSFCFRLRRAMRPGEYLVFDPEATMIRRLHIEGGMDKRHIGVLRFGWRMFEYFHKVLGYYHRRRFLALYPVYFVFFPVVIASWVWNESAAHRGRPLRRIAAIACFCLMLPLLWMVWLARLAVDRVRLGPAPREASFAPYPPEAIAPSGPV